MRIELEYPFASSFKAGYLIVNRENRRIVCLVNNSKDRTTISYARYKMSVNLKRLLQCYEHVDHINEDKIDDAIENLQILTAAENSAKSAKYRYGGELYAVLKCAFCKRIFAKPARLTSLMNCHIGKWAFCNRSCLGKGWNLKNKFDSELALFISQEQVFCTHRY